jgi:hypothetical protein
MRNIIFNALLIISFFLVNSSYATTTVTSCTGVPDYSQSCSSPSNGACEIGTCVKGTCYCGYSNYCTDNNMQQGGSCLVISNGKVYHGNCDKNLRCYN